MSSDAAAESSASLHYRFKGKTAAREFQTLKVKSALNPNPAVLLTNFPPFITKSNLKQVFSDNFGQVVEILLTQNLEENCDEKFQNAVKLHQSEHPPPKSESGLFESAELNFDPFQVEQLTGYGFAYVYFFYEKSCDKVLAHSKKSKTKLLTFDIEPLKASNFIKTVPITDSLTQECDQYLTWFDRHQSHLDDLKSQARQEEEDEGWITVGDDTGVKFSEANQKNYLDKFERKRKKDMSDNFYSSQRKVARKTKADLIREQFEASRKEIAQRRKDRKFKPN